MRDTLSCQIHLQRLYHTLKPREVGPTPRLLSLLNSPSAWSCWALGSCTQLKWVLGLPIFLSSVDFAEQMLLSVGSGPFDHSPKTLNGGLY